MTREEVAPGRPRPVLWPWLLLLLLLVAALIAGAVWLTTRDTRPKVPDVVGQSTPTAVRRIRSDGFVASVHTRVNRGVQSGTIVSQDPEGGSRHTRGSRVTLVAATGSVSTGVPNVVGLAVDQAFVRLQAAGFKGNTVKVASRRAPNTVVSQTPVAGTQAAKGSLVVLKISKVGGQATVPRVVGESEPIATAKLGAAGFKVRVERVASPQPKGRIVTQDPAPGTSAARGSVVGLQVSDGPQAPPPGASGPKVPRVIGMGQAAAFTRIEQAGFRADSFPVASSRTRGLVIRQRPQAGTRAQPKSVVRLAVSLGSGARPLRVVPDVRGMTETNAKRVLVRVGFTVRAVRPPNASPSSGGVVSTQRPGAGVRVRAGSQVAIYLGPPQAQ